MRIDAPAIRMTLPLISAPRTILAEFVSMLAGGRQVRANVWFILSDSELVESPSLQEASVPESIIC